MTTSHRLAALVAAVLVMGGCTTGSTQPVSRIDGIQFSGQIDGRQVVGSDGNPLVVLGDCDPNQGRDQDLCVITNTIDGTQFAFVFENPDLLVPGTAHDVSGDDCEELACDGVTDHAVVDLRVDGDTRRADSGRVTVLASQGSRVALEFRLSFLGVSQITGQLDVSTIPDPS